MSFIRFHASAILSGFLWFGGSIHAMGSRAPADDGNITCPRLNPPTVKNCIDFPEAICKQNLLNEAKGFGEATTGGQPVSAAERYDNLIINDLTFRGSAGDGVNISGDLRRVWIHHNNFSQTGDGLMDIKGNASDISVSWNVFADQRDRSVLIAAGTGETGGSVTLHHNYWLGGYSRLPKIGDYRVHLLNNFYDNPQGKNDVICKGTCQLFAEGNYYIPASGGNVVMASEASDTGVRGKIRTLGNRLRKSARIDEHSASSVFNPRSSYNYQAETADDAMACRIRAFSGPRTHLFMAYQGRDT